MTAATWPTASLGEVIRDAKPGFASGEDPSEGVFQFRMNNLRSDGRFDFSRKRRVSPATKKLDSFLLHPGDVLFNATNSPDLVGKSAFFDGHSEPAVFSNHFVRLRPDRLKLDGRFLARWLQLQFDRWLFQSHCRQWVNQATFGREALLALRLPLPPIEEQRRIAAVLDHVDDLRAKRRAALALLDSLTESTFVRLFGDPIANTAGWELLPLGELGALDRGVSRHRPRNAPELLGGPHPLIQTGEVANSGGYIRTYSATYSDRGLQQSKMWPAGTLCITIAANIARTGILTFDACFPDSVVGFTVSNRATVEYVRAVLTFFQKRLENAAPESAQKNINLRVLRELMVPVPPRELIERFSRSIRDGVIASETMVESFGQLDNLFASLQQRAFAGEL